ncbi:hypothetical protein GCM10027280_61990 [Micromonospora polyrhachis]|uniref:Polyketide cyclase / dehydrase and lipid transport n=1 Tax=Micromonospora polyrhachis TaxID=1282883 RepID=A0A7W7WRD2_9ACTN|nr:hypothetical protein [Micromonospora polyrhachis]MBB4960183.1 hypothetical protein [Micromonospora polyrhachis]
MPALIEVVSVIDAAPSVVFDLELDVDVHTASVRTSQETATTSSGRRQLALGDEVTFRARHFGLRWRMTLGLLGTVVTRALIVPYLRRLLRQRAAHIKYLAEAREP